MYQIEIKIDEELVQKEKAHNIALEKEKAEKKQEMMVAKESKKTKAVVNEMAMMTARQLVVSKVGEVTRDSLLQKKVDVVGEIATTVGAFMIHPVIGALSLATTVASQVMDYNINMGKEQTRIEIMSGRAGYINRSR